MSLNREPNIVSYDFTIPAEKPWSHIVHKGEILRIVDSEGCQAVDTLFYKAGDATERYSAQDTLREQGSAYITTGTKLISNEGNVMAVMIADTSGGHDTAAGACSAEANTVRFGHDTKFMHSCRDNFVSELARHGLTKRDIVSNINFFMNVPIEPNGTLAIVDGVSRAGDYVELRAEMDILVVISNCPQVNNPCNDFNPTPIQTLIRNG
ncbi:MAG: urea amidolyase associated protein UAAP2 [Parvibaculaceae bacterium]